MRAALAFAPALLLIPTILGAQTSTGSIAGRVFDLASGRWLDEIVATGLPHATARRAVGNAVTTVPVGDVVQAVAITTFQDLLSARVPGLRFARLSGNLGTGSPLTLRAAGSFDLART